MLSKTVVWKQLGNRKVMFKIYTDMALQNSTRKCSYVGIQINPDYYLYNLLSADDQVAITEDKYDTLYSWQI